MKRKGIEISADEFDCYRILYAAYMNNELEIQETLRELSSTYHSLYSAATVSQLFIFKPLYINVGCIFDYEILMLIGCVSCIFCNGIPQRIS